MTTPTTNSARVMREEQICARCQHERTDNNKERRTTSLCSKCFMALASHSQCSQCTFTGSRNKVIDHVRSAHKSFCPGGCCKTMSAMLSKHVTALSSADGRLTCVYNNCRFSTDTTSELEKHLMDIHVSEILVAGRFVVRMCTPPRTVHICDTCSRRFESWDTLHNHCQDMIGHFAAGRMFCCNSCHDYTTKNLTTMSRHMNEKHSQTAYKCKACKPAEHILGTASEVFEHVRVKHVSKGSTTDIMCDFCHEPLTLQDAPAHFRMHHIGETNTTGGLKVIGRQIIPLPFRGLYERYQFLTTKPKIPFLVCPSVLDTLDSMQLIHAAVIIRLSLDEYMTATKFPREQLLSALTERCTIPPLPDNAPITGDMLPLDIWWVIMGHMDGASRVSMQFVSKRLRNMFSPSVTDKDRWEYALRNAPFWETRVKDPKKRDTFMSSKTGELILGTVQRIYGSVSMFNTLPRTDKEKMRTYILRKVQLF